MAENPNKTDLAERRLTVKLFAAIVVVVAVAGAIVYFFVGPAVAEALAPGLGLKSAAIIAFVATVVVLVVMAIAAGDGLIGELQYMLIGFGGFFLVLWFMLAWVF